MEQKRGGKMQKAMVEFEKVHEFSMASARREGRDGELMCNGRNKRGRGRNLEPSLRAKD